MRSLALGSFLAALAAYVLGFVVWGLAPVSPFATAPDAAAAAAALEAFPAAGAYLVPDLAELDHAAGVAAAADGYALVFARPQGVDMGSPAGMVQGFLVGWLTAFLAALLLAAAARPERGFGWRVAFVVCVGGAATTWSMVGMAVWWHLPWAFPALNVAYDLAAFALMGAVLARFVGGAVPGGVAS